MGQGPPLGLYRQYCHQKFSNKDEKRGLLPPTTTEPPELVCILFKLGRRNRPHYIEWPILFSSVNYMGPKQADSPPPLHLSSLQQCGLCEEEVETSFRWASLAEVLKACQPVTGTSAASSTVGWWVTIEGRSGYSWSFCLIVLHTSLNMFFLCAPLLLQSTLPFNVSP